MAVLRRRRADRHRHHLRLHALRAQHGAGRSPARSSRSSGSSASSRSLGFELDPFSILVPFLVFAIGVSHGAQKMNGIMQDIGRGTHKLVAARYTFRRLFLAGLTALLADAVGFAVLMVIDIPVIRELAMTASIGVAVLIFTNLLLLPVLLSYTGVSARAARAQPRAKSARKRAARASARCGLRSTASRRAAGRSAPIVVSAVLAVGGFAVSHEAQDRRPRSGRAGAARRLALQPRQRVHHRDTTRCRRDQFAVIVKTEQGRLPQVRDAGRGRPARRGRCGRCRACRRRCRSPTPCARSPPARSRAIRSG